ncbi:MAG: hypothetical protein P1U40_12840 [Coxiellaceae bacterium]|nr:hypothetical protein [Coxiellaceae bacterium]
MAIVVYLNVPTYGYGDIYFAHKIAELLQRRYPAPQQVIKMYECKRNRERVSHLEHLGFISKSQWLSHRPDGLDLDMVVECPMYGHESLNWLVDSDDTPPHVMISEYSWHASVGKVLSTKLRPIRLKTGFAKDEMGVIASHGSRIADAAGAGIIVAEKTLQDDSIGISYCKGYVGRLRYTINHCKQMLANKQPMVMQLAFGNRSSVPNCLEYLAPFFAKHNCGVNEVAISDYGIDESSSFEEIIGVLEHIKELPKTETTKHYYTAILMPSLPSRVFKQLRDYAGSLEADTGDQSFIEGLEAGKVICYELSMETIGKLQFSHKANLRRLYLERMQERLSADACHLLQLLNVDDEDIIASVDDDAIIALLARSELMAEISKANQALVVDHDLSANLFRITDKLLTVARVRAKLSTVHEPAGVKLMVQRFLTQLDSLYPRSCFVGCRVFGAAKAMPIQRFVMQMQRLCDGDLITELRTLLPQALRRLENTLLDHKAGSAWHAISNVALQTMVDCALLTQESGFDHYASARAPIKSAK